MKRNLIYALLNLMLLKTLKETLEIFYLKIFQEILICMILRVQILIGRFWIRFRYLLHRHLMKYNQRLQLMKYSQRLQHFGGGG